MPLRSLLSWLIIPLFACATLVACMSAQEEPIGPGFQGPPAAPVPTQMGGGDGPVDPFRSPTPEPSSGPVNCGDGDTCPTGICVLGPAGVTTCARDCEDGCPDGWSCKLVASAGEYPVPACIYLPATQCHPCTNHNECNTSVDGKLNRCVAHGTEGSFCATSCGPNGVSCPSGNSCQEIAGEQGGTVAVCMAAESTCECSGWAIAHSLSTPCAVSNGAGTCEGTRTCLASGLSECMAQSPMNEMCNGLDDDCDDSVDEGVISPCGTCDKQCVFESSVGDEKGLDASQNPFGGAVSDVFSSTYPVIWIANSPEGTVSRLNTQTGCEEGRYTACADPSRTAVDKDGNGFVACRGNGQVMKIAVDPKDCFDKNGDGIIQTAADLDGNCQISPGEMVGGDECILWTAQLPGASCARSAGIDAEGNAWIGGYSAMKIYLVHGQTGAILKTHSVTVAPYGLAIDQDGIIWIASRSPYSLTRVDPDQGQTHTWSTPHGQAYGIAIDPYGKIWMAGGSGGNGAYRFDPGPQEWLSFPDEGYGMSRGVAIKLNYDNNFQLQSSKVYVAHSGSQWVTVIDAATATQQAPIDLGASNGVVGVAIDVDGYLWTVNQSTSNASKIDTDTQTVVGTYPVGSNPYTYSDMTGYALNTITSMTAVYRSVYEGWDVGPTIWDSVEVQATLPGQTRVEFQVRLGDTPTALKEAPWSEKIGPFPAMTFPHPLGLSAKFLEVRVLMVADDDGSLPTYHKSVIKAHHP